MRSLSIKLRVALWYTGIMILLAAASLAVLLSLSSRFVQHGARDRLEGRVALALKEAEWDREERRLDIDDDLKVFEDGVWIGIYDGQGYPLYGQAPEGFPEGVVFEDRQIRMVSGGSAVWYVYDIHRIVPGYGSVWVRGAASRSDAEEAFAAMIRMAVFLFPFLAALAAGGGYLITRRAFLPIAQMAETARRISTGGDLTERIGLGKGNDELYQLAETFDSMLSRLQGQFEKEKQFTADVSHELRTPISVILSRCEYALGHMEDGEGRESLQIVLDQARKMARLVSQLLMLSRADGNRLELQLEDVDLSVLFEVVIQEQEAAASEKSITIQPDIQPDVMVQADETMMMRLLINLISNAITYGKVGGHIRVGLSKSSGTVHGYVEDDGVGIPNEHLDRIWDRFYQVDPSRTAEDGRGAGLGLSMVKWIVSSHGGDIHVESRVGEGSRFSFEFPSRQPPAT